MHRQATLPNANEMNEKKNRTKSEMVRKVMKWIVCYQRCYKLLSLTIVRDLERLQHILKCELELKLLKFKKVQENKEVPNLVFSDEKPFLIQWTIKMIWHSACVNRFISTVQWLSKLWDANSLDYWSKSKVVKWGLV